VTALARRAALTVEDGTVVIDGADVTRAIRTPEIDRAATAVARMPGVRAVLVDRQRALGQAGGVVMEGRDIGTVVFPEADVKIYLDASPDERARRRAADPAHGGGPARLAEVATEMAARDRLDRTRATSPLTVAADAALVDTTGVPVDEVVARVIALIEQAVR
jgi:cytidylate kinase